jgi:hypothetical protein
MGFRKITKQGCYAKELKLVLGSNVFRKHLCMQRHIQKAAWITSSVPDSFPSRRRRKAKKDMSCGSVGVRNSVLAYACRKAVSACRHFDRNFKRSQASSEEDQPDFSHIAGSVSSILRSKNKTSAKELHVRPSSRIWKSVQNNQSASDGGNCGRWIAV